MQNWIGRRAAVGLRQLVIECIRVMVGNFPWLLVRALVGGPRLLVGTLVAVWGPPVMMVKSVQRHSGRVRIIVGGMRRSVS